MINEIYNLIYDHNRDDKFIVDEATGKKKLNMNYMERVNAFTTLKKWIRQMSNSRNGQINLGNLITILDNYSQMVQVQRIAMEFDVIKIEKCPPSFKEAIFDEVLMIDPYCLSLIDNEHTQIEETNVMVNDITQRVDSLE